MILTVLFFFPGRKTAIYPNWPFKAIILSS